MLEGYDYEFVINTSKTPGSDHYFGIINPELISRIENFRPDIIMVYGWKFHSHLSAIIHFSGKKKIYFRGDSHLLDRRLLNTIKNYFKYPLLKWVYSHVDYYLSPGIASDEYFNFYGRPGSKILRMVHAVDNDRFMFVDSNTLASFIDKWRHELKLNKDAFIFLYAGKFEEIKNVNLLVEAYKRIYKKISPSYLILVGSGIQKSVIEQSIRDLSSNIKIIPFINQSQMPYVYRLAHVFVLPSKSETWGLSINEALACKIKVIASDACGCNLELIQSGRNGYVFKSNDISDLENKMYKVYFEESSMNIESNLNISDFSIKRATFQFVDHILKN